METVRTAAGLLGMLLHQTLAVRRAPPETAGPYASIVPGAAPVIDGGIADWLAAKAGIETPGLAR